MTDTTYFGTVSIESLRRIAGKVVHVQPPSVTSRMVADGSQSPHLLAAPDWPFARLLADDTFSDIVVDASLYEGWSVDMLLDELRSCNVLILAAFRSVTKVYVVDYENIRRRRSF